MVWENTSYNFYSFKFTKVCFMAQIVICLGKCSVWAWEECTLLSLEDVFYTCQLNQLIDGVARFSDMLLIFRQLSLSISERGMLRSLIIIVDLSMTPCSSISFCLTYFEALFLGANTLRIILSSWITDHSIITQCPSLSLITFCTLESA